MGLEARCRVRHGAKNVEAKAFLETTEVIVRGELKLTIPFREIRAVRAKDGRLEIEWSEGTTQLELGAAAESWAKKIANPKSLIDKLGVKPDQRVSVTGIDDDEFLRQLQGRTATAMRSLRRDGAIWVLWPKGRAALKDSHVRAAAISAGLVDVKVAAFSATLSALKLVIPVARR